MFRIKNMALLLAALLLLAVVLPTQALAAEDEPLTLEWVRNTKGESIATYHSYMDPLPLDREGNVYLSHLDGHLYAYAPDRSLKWKVDLQQFSYNRPLYLGLGPVLDEQGNCYMASANRKVYKIDPDGHVLHEFLMSGAVADSTSPALSPDGGTLYVVTASQTLYALHTSDLSEKWQARTKGSSAAVTPLVSPDGTVIAGAGRTVTAFDPDSGEVKWEYTLPQDRYLYQVYRQGHPNIEKRMQADSAGNIYFMTYVVGGLQKQNELVCLAPPAGAGSEPQVRWSKAINIEVSAAALHGDTLYYCTADNRLHAVRTADGQTKWELEIDAEGQTLAYRAPTVAADGKIYFHMGGIVGVARDEGSAGTLLGKCRLPSKRMSLSGAVSQLGPRGEIYVTYTDVDNNYWLAKLVDHSFTPQPGAIELSPEEQRITMVVGGLHTPALTLRDVNGVLMEQSGLVFTSRNPVVLSTAGGVLAALQAGSAEVEITHPANETLRETIEVTVLADLSDSELRITTAPLEIAIGQTRQLAAELLAPGGEKIRGEALEWSSSNAAVAEVSSTGRLQGQSAGSATLRVRLANHPEITAAATVTVRESIVQQVTLAEINTKINRTVAYYRDKGAPGNDWSVFALNAVGEDLRNHPYVTGGRTYLDNLEAKVKEPGYFSLMTDYERTVIALVSAGADPSNFAGMNLLEKIYNYPSLSQGINAAVFALIALDAANADIPPQAVHSRDSLISFILENRVREGWCFGGVEPDPDMTGMALYALAPYRDRPAVREAGEAAIRWLSEVQHADGTLTSWGTKNSESIAQAIMGVTAWGVDPQGPMFTKQSGNLVTALLGFYFEESGMFGHVYGTPDPAMATDQGLQALAALRSYMQKGYSDIFYKIVSAGSDPQEITSLEITPEGLELPPGCEVQLRAADQSGRYVDNAQVSWFSSDPAVASIDADSILIAHQPGRVQVTVILREDESVRDTVSLRVFGDDEFSISRAENPLQLFGVDRAITLTVANQSDLEETVVMILTLVNRDTGKMVNSSYITKKIAPGDTAELSGAVHVPASGNYEVKAMLWNGWDKLRPLMNAVAE